MSVQLQHQVMPTHQQQGMAAPQQGLLQYDAQQISQVWDSLSIQLSPPDMLIAMPVFVFHRLGEAGRTFLKEKYIQCGGGAKIMFALDGAMRTRIFMADLAYFQKHRVLNVPNHLPIVVTHVTPDMPGTKQTGLPQGQTAAAGKTEKVPRPPNAFIIYRKHNHSTIVKQNPDLHNNQISIIIGAMWSHESDEVREEYKKKAEEAKEEHLRKYPDYQYQPRKPSEKKKRMTKKKAAALAACVSNAQPTESFEVPVQPTESFQLAAQYPALQMVANSQQVNINGSIPGNRSINLPLTASDMQRMISNQSNQRSSHETALGEGVQPALVYQSLQHQDMALVQQNLRQAGSYAFNEMNEAFNDRFNVPDL